MSAPNDIPMHYSEAYGNLPAWVWRAVAGARHDAEDAMPVLVLREGKRPLPGTIVMGQHPGLVLVDLDDWTALRAALEGESER